VSAYCRGFIPELPRPNDGSIAPPSAGLLMLVAHLRRDPAVIAGLVRIVVLADLVFTATPALAQPVIGVLLAREAGYEPRQGWVVLSAILD